jgi:hypothetical protein
MLRRLSLIPIALTLVLAGAVAPAAAQDAFPAFTREQLDNLVAPIALYPDALLAQVLVAATMPDQVDDAARFVRANGTANIDDQSWDVSVKAVAHYPTALNMMADKLDWTTALGQAYASQSSDVMESVQRLRGLANSQGNLVSTEQQQVVVNDGYYTIVPVRPRVIYVPVYDPVVIYTRPVFYAGGWGGFWAFGIGFPIGAWLSYDMDWRGRRVYYDGWNGGGWRVRSRPYVVITNVYVNPRYERVYVNHDVIRRPVNYENVDRYRRVHGDVHFGPRPGAPPVPEGRGSGNRVIDHNASPQDRHINDNRGRELPPPVARPITPPAERNGPPAQRPDGPPGRGDPPDRGAPPVAHPTPVPTPETAPHPFGRSEGRFDPNEASRRGAASRTPPQPAAPPPQRAAPPPQQGRPQASPPRQAEPARTAPAPAPRQQSRPRTKDAEPKKKP